MTADPLPFSERDLPTDSHRSALEIVLTELATVEHALLVTGSVAQRRATDRSDLDLLAILNNGEACAGVASLAIGRVNDAAERHGIVAVTRYHAGVKISLRIMELGFVQTFYVQSDRHSIWKTHSVKHKRVTPEVLIRRDGTVETKPFSESRSKGGYCYPVTTQGQDGEVVLNVESTMVLTAKLVRAQGIPADIPRLLGAVVLQDPAEHSLPMLRTLTEAKYLDPARVSYLASLAVSD